MKSRKQRKLEAKQNNEVFVPQYNGTGVLSFEDYHGVGNERFNNKFVRFVGGKEEVVEPLIEEKSQELLESIPIEDKVIDQAVELNDGQGKIDEVTENRIKVELVEESTENKKVKKQSKFKQKLKKLFNK